MPALLNPTAAATAGQRRAMLLRTSRVSMPASLDPALKLGTGPRAGIVRQSGRGGPVSDPDGARSLVQVQPWCMGLKRWRAQDTLLGHACLPGVFDGAGWLRRRAGSGLTPRRASQNIQTGPA